MWLKKYDIETKWYIDYLINFSSSDHFLKNLNYVYIYIYM
jgi:hypothetical protein